MTIEILEKCPKCGDVLQVVGSGLSFRCGTWIASDSTTTVDEGRDCITRQRDLLTKRVAELEGVLETAWGLIANVSGGDWSQQPIGWQEAVFRWRDKDFHPIWSEVSAKMALKAKGQP